MLCADEKSQIQALDRSQPVMPGMPERRTHDYLRHGIPHNTPEIRTWLARRPRFHVHFTPTGSSRMNQVERWFGLLTGKLIRRGVHTSVQALENDIRDWIATWNDNPRPFSWTETADEILNSLADYLAKVGASHNSNKQN